MPNTKSAKKAVRSSENKRSHNLSWKNRFKTAIKNIKKSIDNKDSVEVLNEQLVHLQKMLDKSSKEKVIHKNKANRLKSIYARKVSAQTTESKDKDSSVIKKTVKKSISKSTKTSTKKSK